MLSANLNAFFSNFKNIMKAAIKKFALVSHIFRHLPVNSGECRNCAAVRPHAPVSNNSHVSVQMCFIWMCTKIPSSICPVAAASEIPIHFSCSITTIIDMKAIFQFIKAVL